MWLTLALVVFVPGCAIAARWQISRAEGGNDLSYLYSVMWPAFGLLGLYFWWMLIHTDFDAVGLRGMRNQAARVDAPAAAAAAVESVAVAEPTGDEDPELAAYNARLAALSDRGPKTWRNTETVVARRPQ
jgi:hypothetical protein